MNMNEEKDIPQIPFKRRDVPGSDCCHIEDVNGEEFAIVDSTTTLSAYDGAEFIILACNSHDKLVNALQRLTADVDRQNLHMYHDDWHNALNVLDEVTGATNAKSNQISQSARAQRKEGGS
jgi:aspartate/glutamate racemase